MIDKVISRYKVLEKLGAGGMGEVYLAEDSELDRKIALKFLPPQYTEDPDVNARFKREAKAAAALSHPNIITVYDVGEHEDKAFIAMEYVPGQSLSDLMSKEGLSIDKIIDIASQICEGLNEAHQAGIFHRDIKPDNILIDPKGRVKIADFGLAMAQGQTKLTAEGTTMGTLYYMSPEQLSGAPVDHCTDIWSVGVVLYEMITGQLPFKADYDAAVSYSILHEEPEPLARYKTGVSEGLQRIIDKALDKDKETRYQNVADLLTDLKREKKSGSQMVAPIAAKRHKSSRAFVMTAIIVVFAVLVTFIVVDTLQKQTQKPTQLSLRPLTSFEGVELWPSWSPDGSQIVFGHTRHGSMDIFVMSLGGGEPREITESPYDETMPRWSRDGTKIAFLSDRGNGSTIYWVPATGGVERKITETHIPYLERWDAVDAIGAMPWSPDGNELVFSRLQPTGEIALWIVNLNTGEERQITYPSEGADDFHSCWSWDGKWIAFSRDVNGKCSLILQPVDGGEARVLAEGEYHHHGPAWSPDDRTIAVFSNRSGLLNIWEIDVDSGNLRQLTTGTGNDLKPVYSQKGEIVFAIARRNSNLFLGPVNAPASEHRRLTSHTRIDLLPRISPDGKNVVYQSRRTGNDEIWLLDIETGAERQLTNHQATDRIPDWSPDGTHIIFVSNRSGAFQLWIMNPDGGAVRRLAEQTIPMPAYDWSSMTVAPRWSPDGKAIGYLVAGSEGRTLWWIDPEGTKPQASQLSGILRFDWYRDSHHVVYNSKTTDGSGATEMRLANLETGQEVVLVKGLTSEVTVAPDCKAISYCRSASHFDQSLYILQLAESGKKGELPTPVGEPRRLTDGHGKWHVHNGGWSKESDQVVYSREESLSDIYAIINPNRR